METQKSNISRLESGNYNPSLDLLSKLAKGLEKEIHIELRIIFNDFTRRKMKDGENN